MKKMKVLTSMLLACMMVVTACSGGSGGNGGNSGTATNAPSPEATAEPSQAPDATPEPTDLGGRTIRIAAWWDDKPKGETANEIARLEKMAELEKAYNFKFEFINIPFEEYMDKFTTTVLAGEPFADVAIMEFKRAIVPVKSGLVLPLSEFTTPGNDINNEQKLVTKLPALGGDEYAFSPPFVSVVGLHYNRDLFKRLGLEDPQTLYANGQWTWDKFLEMAKEATRDTDNDGKIDSFGFSGWPADMARHFGASNGVTFVNESSLADQAGDPRMIETLEFVNRVVNVENVMKVKTGNKMDWNETNTFKDGDVAMSIQYDWNIADLTFEAGVVPIPKGPQSDGEHTYANAALNGWFIPKGVKDPQIVYHIFEEMRNVPPTEEYLGQDWLEARYKSEADIQMALEHINGTGMISIEEGVPDYPFYGILDDIIVNSQSVTATIEKFKQQGADALAKLSQ
ncbi:ABC transporter substrate-binding protein [Paenibacillus arenilitoris]|uniref:Carbohydrate ABC transporter substrate-binding protein n=1 Tax=Paenibacillus arenilitoris TaxID=2772299 RepID=A0A927CKN5_9BACL|nr:ABC transporter substrate-binding protein [Paenibacillus arenilitoris]MBD2869304.1 carbohydrate ABC transporter substrate-binding protein [Paenibacillus arenilitoris]